MHVHVHKCYEYNQKSPNKNHRSSSKYSVYLYLHYKSITHVLIHGFDSIIRSIGKSIVLFRDAVRRTLWKQCNNVTRILSTCYAFPENLIRQTILSNFPGTALRNNHCITDLVRYDRSARMLDNNVITILAGVIGIIVISLTLRLCRVCGGSSRRGRAALYLSFFKFRGRKSR